MLTSPFPGFRLYRFRPALLLWLSTILLLGTSDTDTGPPKAQSPCDDNLPPVAILQPGDEVYMYEYTIRS